MDLQRSETDNLDTDRARLKAAMGQLSRQIGEARRRGEDVTELVARMRRLSEERRLIADDRPAPLKADRHAVTQENGGAAEVDGVDRIEVRGVPVGTADARVCELTISPLSDPGAWDAYVRAHPRGSVYHLHCWRTIIESSFGHETHYLEACTGDRRICGILPLVRQKSRLFGDFLVSLPFVTYGGAIGDSTDVEERLMQAAAERARSLGCRHVEFRDPVQRERWPARTDKYSLRLELPAAAEALWQRFTPKLRSQIRRGEREAPAIRVGGHELLPDFYRVFSRNMRDLGTPVYSLSFFEHIFEHVTAHARVIVLDLDRSPAAAAIVIGDGQMLEIPWASSLREVNSQGINMVLYWQVLQHAIESGHRTFDFGRSTRDAGTYRFKRQWGAEPVPLFWHYWLADGGEVPRLNPDNPRYRLAITAWQKLPVWIANVIGPRLVRNLP
jgi:serine/alanine adding enzyme